MAAASLSTAASRLLEEILLPTLEASAAATWQRVRTEVGAGVDSSRFGALCSSLARPLRARPLAPSAADRRRAAELLPGWSIERLQNLEAARILLVLALPTLAEPAGAATLEDAFRYADEGELRALLKSLCLLPEAERFRWRAEEGCRSNMRSVFEAAACDTPYPALHFDDLAFRQLAIKALFVGAPLWRVYGLDQRLSPDLARMALDLVDERRSAGREVPPALWACLGAHGGARGREALERELVGAGPRARAAVGLALARAGERERLAELRLTETDPQVAELLAGAAAGRCGAETFGALDPEARPGIRA
jgi:hypothetical protein